MIEKGSIIVYKMNNQLKESIVVDHIIDPLKRHINKYKVIIENESYGIPENEVISYKNKIGFQFSLFADY